MSDTQSEREAGKWGEEHRRQTARQTGGGAEENAGKTHQEIGQRRQIPTHTANDPVYWNAQGNHGGPGG